MIKPILLQAAIEAGLLLMNTVFLIFVLSSITALIYFMVKAIKRGSKISASFVLLSIFRALGIALALVLLFMGIMLIWNPELE